MCRYLQQLLGARPLHLQPQTHKQKMVFNPVSRAFICAISFTKNLTSCCCFFPTREYRECGLDSRSHTRQSIRTPPGDPLQSILVAQESEATPIAHEASKTARELSTPDHWNHEKRTDSVRETRVGGPRDITEEKHQRGALQRRLTT